LVGVRFTACPVVWDVREIPEMVTVKESRDTVVGTEAGTVLSVKLIGRDDGGGGPPDFGRPLQEASEMIGNKSRGKRILLRSIGTPRRVSCERTTW
jgi:hypothetical protein